MRIHGASRTDLTTLSGPPAPRTPRSAAPTDRFERRDVKASKEAESEPRAGRGLRVAGWSAMGLGLAALALTPAIGLAPGALLVIAAQYLLLRGGAQPLG